ncbi:uncharacterized protein M6B38_331830 [Iris pallida]|uniref:Uncharacterized protein n=1 Tax=Iris pallida TaxID=29817 RepID=A0AAX6H3Q8_IRIPA|nr:uncharacterized protein M6B38_331830 [Iris pallida]
MFLSPVERKRPSLCYISLSTLKSSLFLPLLCGLQQEKLGEEPLLPLPSSVNFLWPDYFYHECSANPGAKVFRTKGLSNYEALSRIFKLSTATGLLSRASTQRPLDSDEERALDDEFANPDFNTISHPIMCDGVDDIGIESTAGDRRKAKGQSSKRPSKSPKTSKLDKCMDAITSASNARTDKFVKAQAALEQFNMSKCMDVFNTMQGIPTNQGIKALDVLANSATYREAFLKMKEDFRHAWMMSLGSSD